MKADILLRDITAANFRANPRYELVLFDRLPPEQQAMFADLQKDPDLYGILRPREPSGWGIKSACRDTALLYLTLQQPGLLPAYVRPLLGEDCNQAIAELVLDGVLEIERVGARDGSEAFVSGSEAYELLYEGRPPAMAEGKLARLSVDALKYAQTLAIDDVARLSARLYFYNRLPASPRWLQRLPTPDAVAKYLGIAEGGPHWHTLRRHWSKLPLTPPLEGWRMWQRREERGAARPRSTYKLYVSPACESLPEVFGVTVQFLNRAPSMRFKVGLDVYGLLRPDKIIIYFGSFDALRETADRLWEKLEGCAAHGVPFTAELTGDGLLSWGMDPPQAQQALGWQERESWRLWLTNRLATALQAARSARLAMIQPWQFAMERLELEGVNTATWTPVQTIWEKDQLGRA